MFLIDAQLPFSLASHLKKVGQQAIHTSDLPNKNFTSDSEIIRLSEELSAIVVTKDIDFLNSFIIHGYPKKIILIKTGNISNRVLISLFEENLNLILESIGRSNVIELHHNQIIELY